ncbi:MAG: translocation/assembly module TamB domain-containing protein, partial [Pseudomonadota bacterium]
MRRLLIISLVVIVGLLLFLAIATGVLLNTDRGRNFIRQQIEPAIAGAIDGDARIGSIGGAPPGRIVVRNVALSSASTGDIFVDAVDLVWSPLALLRGDIVVESLSVDGATIRLPASAGEEAETPEDDAASPPTIPQSLPSIAVGDLSFKRIRILDPDGNEMTTLSGKGAVETRDRRVKALFSGASADGADTLEMDIDVDADGDRSRVALALRAAADGAVARFAQTGGPVSLDINGDGPTRALSVDIEGAFGAYGETTATIAAVTETAEGGVSLTGAFTPGDKLSDVSDAIGERISFDALLSGVPDNGRLVIRRIDAPAGAVNGDIAWTTRRNRLETVEAGLQAAIAPNRWPALDAYLGDSLNARVAIKRAADAYAFSLDADAPKAALSVVDGSTDLAAAVSGDVLVTAQPNIDALGAPPLALRVSTNLSADAATGLILDDIAVLESERQLFAGVARYDLEQETIAANGAVTLPATFYARLSEDLSGDRPLTAQISISGPADNIALTLEADAPALQWAERALPAALIKAEFAGLPATPNGEIEARALQGRGVFRSVLRSSADGSIAVPQLEYRGENFDLESRLAWEPATENLEVNAVYAGRDGAEPAPGVPLTGDIAIGGFISLTDESRLTVAASVASGETAAIDGLDATIAGVPDNLALTATASSVTASGAEPIANLAVGARLDVSDALIARLSTFAFDYGGQPISLRETATINLADGVDVSGAVFDIFRRGELSIDAALKGSTARAVVRASSLPVDAVEGSASFSIDLDTDREVIASGDFALRSDFAEAEAEPIAGAFTWRQGHFVVEDTMSETPLVLLLDLPLTLQREPSLGATLDGDIAGQIAFDGPVQSLAAFMPEPLQGLEGALDLNATLSGPIDAPRVDGALLFADGAYTELESGVSFTNITARADAAFDGAETHIKFTSSASGAGQDEATIRFDGDVAIAEESSITSELTLDGARIAAAPILDTTASGAIAFGGALDALTATGEIIIEELNAEIVTPESTGLVGIDVVFRNGAIESDDDPAPLVAETEETVSVRADIAVRADDRIFIRGRGLESEWRADLKAVAGARETIVVGDVNLRRGVLDFSGRRFELTTGNIVFDRLSPNNPVIDLRAEYETGDGVVAAIIIKGRGQSPSVTLESTPSLPREDVMALVLFGKPANELSATESIQMAQALAQLGGVGPFGGG